MWYLRGLDLLPPGKTSAGSAKHMSEHLDGSWVVCLEACPVEFTAGCGLVLVAEIVSR